MHAAQQGPGHPTLAMQHLAMNEGGRKTTFTLCTLPALKTQAITLHLTPRYLVPECEFLVTACTPPFCRITERFKTAMSRPKPFHHPWVLLVLALALSPCAVAEPVPAQPCECVGRVIPRCMDACRGSGRKLSQDVPVADFNLRFGFLYIYSIDGKFIDADTVGVSKFVIDLFDSLVVKTKVS